jgi:hypothetical protein
MLERRGSKEEAVMVGKGSPKLNVMARGSPNSTMVISAVQNEL